MENLNTSELLIAKKLVQKGLLKAAESLSFFMKEDLGISEFDFQVHDRVECPYKKGSNIHLLTTEIMGELPGICYLVFSEEEADKLRGAALSGEVGETPELLMAMNEAIMLEVDNIISASVITEFSNILNHRIYGNVPSLRLVNESELKQLINTTEGKDMFVINFKTQFLSPSLDFCPEFVWKFDHRFLSSVKSLAGREVSWSLN